MNEEALSYDSRVVPKDAIKKEIQRFRTAVLKTKSEFIQTREKVLNVLGKSHASLIDAHLLILEDPLVCMGDCLPEHGQLLLEAIHGKQTWFLTFDEVRTAWRLIDPLQHHLEKASTPLHQYPAGGMGPEEAVPWAEKDRVKWMA
jgi:hypothetical protein